ncbi:RUN domain-containing protein 3B [Bulinus truncatus]|nr:RUN domain-containing protein 3B [Bulinus truncatus]
MLARRQINIQKQNLAAMCRISVKSLLDYACLYTHVDDDCEEFINFCAVFEQLVSHRLKPYQKKVWLPGNGSPRHFWNVLQENQNTSHGNFFQTCIPNIEAIESLKSPKAKLRAFIRVALMEKRLSDYMFWLLDNPGLIRESYFEGAIMSSEEASVLCGDLIGLNAIDFNFCLKGNENELLGPLEISYFPFIKYKQMSASKSVDDLEMQLLSGKITDQNLLPSSAVLTENNVNDFLRLQILEKDFKSVKEQKDYLEELLRLRERQIAEINLKHESFRVERDTREKELENEYKTMHACILELQAEMSKLRKQNENLKTQVQSLKSFREKMEMLEVPMIDMASAKGGQDKPDILVEMDHIEHRFSIVDKTLDRSDKSLIPCDQRSIVSTVSENIHIKEDTQSMIPLTGSLMDVNVTLTEPKEFHTSDVDSVQSNTNAVSDTTFDNSSSVLIAVSQNQRFPIMSPGSEAEQTNQEDSVHLLSGTIPTNVTDGDISHLPEEIHLVQDEHLDNNTNSNDSDITVAERNVTSQIPHVSNETFKYSESEKEEEAVASDPEIINKSTSSSEVGDNTWDMMSDAEHDIKGISLPLASVYALVSLHQTSVYALVSLPLTSVYALVSLPLTSVYALVSLPLTSVYALVSLPLTSVYALVSLPLTSVYALVSLPLTSVYALVSLPLTSVYSLVSLPLTSVYSLVSLPLASVYALVSLHQTSVYALVSLPLTSVYALVSLPLTSVYALVSLPLTSVYALVSLPLTSVYALVSLPLTSVYALVSLQRTSVYALVSLPLTSVYALVSLPLTSVYALVSLPLTSVYALVSLQRTSVYALVSLPLTSVYALVSLPLTSVYALVSLPLTSVCALVSLHLTSVYALVSLHQTSVYALVSLHQTSVYALVSLPLTTVY